MAPSIHYMYFDHVQCVSGISKHFVMTVQASKVIDQLLLAFSTNFTAGKTKRQFVSLIDPYILRAVFCFPALLNVSDRSALCKDDIFSISIMSVHPSVTLVLCCKTA